MLGIEVDKIIIYPLGGISKFKLTLNISPEKEMLILIMGPLSQFIAYLILMHIFPYDIVLIKKYHYGILFFNLLPIYPLDGGKFINIVLSLRLSFKESLLLSIIISYITITLVLAINHTNIQLNLILMIAFLIYKVTKEYRQIDFIYQKFILERYLYKYKFKKGIIINNPGKFHRNKRHLLKLNDKYYLEEEYLEKIYKKDWHLKLYCAIIQLLTAKKQIVMGH